jgi:5-keto 4-deoxyuronate isomerase
MDKASLVFCGGSLGACLLIAVVAFPYAALSKEDVISAKSLVDAEEIGVMNLGDFGDVTVSEMVSYYMENPPAPVAIGAAPKKVRFEGC